MELTDVCEATNKASPQQLQRCDEACWCCKDRGWVKGCMRARVTLFAAGDRKSHHSCRKKSIFCVSTVCCCCCCCLRVCQVAQQLHCVSSLCERSQRPECCLLCDDSREPNSTLYRAG